MDTKLGTRRHVEPALGKTRSFVSVLPSRDIKVLQGEQLRALLRRRSEAVQVPPRYTRSRLLDIFGT